MQKYFGYNRKITPSLNPRITKKGIIIFSKQKAKSKILFPFRPSLSCFISEEENHSPFIYIVNLMPGLVLKRKRNPFFNIASSSHLVLLKPIS